LARHVGNALVRNDSRGHRIVKEHKDSTRRIDLAVAAVTAHAWAVGQDQLPMPAIY
jgi:phage terminase large subunit-like protein